MEDTSVQTVIDGVDQVSKPKKKGRPKGKTNGKKPIRMAFLKWAKEYSGARGNKARILKLIREEFKDCVFANQKEIKEYVRDTSPLDEVATETVLKELFAEWRDKA